MPISYDDRYVLRPGHKVNYTKEMVWELQKCASDIVYFAENYFTVLHPIHGKKRLCELEGLYDFQKDMIKNFSENRFSIVLASRQVGKTTCSCIYLLWFALFNTDKTLAILANKQSTAQSIVGDIKIAYEQLPAFMKPGVKKYDALTIEFDNGTTVFSRATSEDALRGESVSLLFLDEFAFVPENVADAFWASNFPTISTGGSIIIVSTPNGTAGLYYELWKKASNREKDNRGVLWKSIRIRWDQHPDRDEKWKDEMLESIGKVKFSQEFDCSFTGSTYTLITGDTLEKLNSIDPAFYVEEGYYLWKRPEPNRIYLMGGDVAKGANSDFHVLNIFDVTDFYKNGKYEQVAIFRRNDISAFDFKDKIIEIGKQWNDAMVIIENNDIGHAVVQNLYFDDGYENTWFNQDKGEYGIRATTKTKPIALSYFKEDIESFKMLIHSEDMVRELSYYEEIRTGIFGARNGREYHDDTVASGYWVSYALRSLYFQDFYEWWLKNHDSNYNKLMDINKDSETHDNETADLFLKALGGYSNFDKDMEDFKKDLTI